MENEPFSFPCFHVLKLDNDVRQVICAGYQVYSKEDQVYDALPFIFILHKPSLSSVQPNSKNTFCIDLLESMPSLSRFKNRVTKGFMFDELTMKKELIDLIFEKGWINKAPLSPFPLSSIPEVGEKIHGIKKIIEWIKARFSVEKTLRKAANQFEQQSRVLYYYLIQSYPVVVLFWKDSNPTVHIVINGTKETKESIANYFYSCGVGVGEYDTDFFKRVSKTP